jgi:hypothetical protein
LLLLKRLSPIILSFVFIIFPVFAVIIGAWYEGQTLSRELMIYSAILLSGFAITKCSSVPSKNGANLPCRSCRRLRSFDLDCKKSQDQKIAACGSSYMERGCNFRGRTGRRSG